jgi:hypothetical protein
MPLAEIVNRAAWFARCFVEMATERDSLRVGHA